MAIPIPPQHGFPPQQQPRPMFPPEMAGGLGPRPGHGAGMGPGPGPGPGPAHHPPQHGPGGDMFGGRFANMGFGGGMPPKQEQPKAPKPPAGLKPGAVVAHEGYTFDRLDGWEIASKRPIRVSQDDLAKKTGKKGPTDIIDQMRKMSAARRAQIDRLIDEKARDEKEPWYEWSPVAVEDGRSRVTKKGGKDIREVLTMDVFIVRKAKKDIPVEKEEKKEPKKPTPRIHGTVVNVREPLKSKEPGHGEMPKPKDPFPGFGGGGMFGRPAGQPGPPFGGAGPPQQGGVPPHLNGLFGGGGGGGGFGPKAGGIPGGGMPGGGMHGGGMPAGGMHGGGMPGSGMPAGGIHGGGMHHGGGMPGGGAKKEPPIKIINDHFDDDIPIVGEHRPKKHNKSHSGGPFFNDFEPLKMPKKKKSMNKFVPESDVSFSEDEGISISDDLDEVSSATSLHSMDFERHVPSRGSLKSPRRRSKGPEGPVYREHRREKSFADPPPRRRESRYAGEAYDLYTERRRPPLSRRSTVAYSTGPRRLTNGESPPLSPRPHSPPRRSSGLLWPDEFDRGKNRERELEDYLREKVLQDREDALRRRELDVYEIERERRKREELERLDVLERLTRRSDPIERYGFGRR